MIIHTENTAKKAPETFSYYFSHNTGKMVHFASRVNAVNSPSTLIEIVVDAHLYAQDIDVILDINLPKAQQAATAAIEKQQSEVTA